MNIYFALAGDSFLTIKAYTEKASYFFAIQYETYLWTTKSLKD